MEGEWECNRWFSKMVAAEGKPATQEGEPE
jgi:hypothetical protein